MSNTPSIASFFSPTITRKTSEPTKHAQPTQKPTTNRKRKLNSTKTLPTTDTDQEELSVDKHTSNKRPKAPSNDEQKKPKKKEKSNNPKTDHSARSVLSRSSTPAPDAALQPTPITIDLTLDSPVKCQRMINDGAAVPAPSEPRAKPAGKPPGFKTSTQKEPSSNDKSAAWPCKTFADYEETRRQRIVRNTWPMVEASWPSHDLLHHRFLDPHPVDRLRPSKPLELKKNKGKKPLRIWALEEGEDERRWMKSITMAADEVGASDDLAPPPTLERLDLQPPVNLIPGARTDPTYRHPLLARLLKLISWPHPHHPFPYDHPSLRRQHHRSYDSLTLPWTTIFAPKRAAEILGKQNLLSSLTLKSWLLEIALKDASNHIPDDKDRRSSSARDKSEKSRKKGVGKRRKAKGEEKKRVIIRAVDRRPRRKRGRLLDGEEDESDGLEDFIVSDGEEEDTIYAQDILISDSEMGGGGCSPRKRRQSVSVLHPEFAPTAHRPGEQDQQQQEESPEATFEFDRLTNLILLQGPHGTGKSCTVHAVAEELGWEVFEVNPGQLRTRKEVDRLIGDVSKNHVLSCSSKPLAIKPHADRLSRPKSTVNPFEMMMKATKSQSVQDTQIEKEMKPRSKLEQAGSGRGDDGDDDSEQSSQKKTKQTLILLEEVDIVYGQDKDFWGGVIELVSKSMRPVVMTCNDSSVIPLTSLPVQTVLEFEAAESDLVSRFLEVVCLVCGYRVERELLERLYLEHVYRLPVALMLTRRKRSATHQVELFQEPSSTSPAHRLPPDLRRTLCQLQFLCQWSIGSLFSGVDWLDLQEDRSSKMLFCSNPFSLPTHPPTPAPCTPNLSNTYPFDRFGDGHFELDWLPHFLSHHHPSNSRPHPSHAPQQSEPLTQAPSVLAQQLQLLARAHDGLSFGDAYIDKDSEVEIDQFESELVLLSTDNVLVGSHRGGEVVELKRGEGERVLLKPEEVGEYEMEQQIVHPHRPFSAAHYRPESAAMEMLLEAIFSLFFSSPPRSSPFEREDDDHQKTLKFVDRFFRVFEHAHLLEARSDKLKEMDGYMDFGGSRAFTMPLGEYILDYCPLVRRVVEAEDAPERRTERGAPPAGGRLTRASAAVAAAVSGGDCSDNVDEPVLSLLPDELLLFRNSQNRFLV